ncbi:hypothetical protein STPL106120_06220 [Streptococcus pluranimalium]|uniref:SEC10/PgrA surface exclusion domain-containing protein n=1 Tax=Streptococcus pluranimalium TaxID=82348 RepID=UPI0039EBE03B
MKNKTLKGTSILALTVAATATSSTINADEVVQPANQTAPAETVVTDTTSTNVTDQQLAEAKQNVDTAETVANQAGDVYKQAIADQTSQQEVVDTAQANFEIAEQAKTMTLEQVEQVQAEVDSAASELPQAESAVTEAQTNVDKAQALADQPVTKIVDQTAVDDAQSEVDEQTKNVSAAQAEITKANADLASAKAKAKDAETLLARADSDKRDIFTSDFDFEAEYGVTAMEYWNSVGGDTNVMSFDGKSTDLSEQSELMNSIGEFMDENFFDNVDETDKIWNVDLNNLSDFEFKTITNYAVNTITGLRESMQKQLAKAGSNIILPKVQVTEESVASSKAYAKWILENYPEGFDGHVIRKAASDVQLKDTLIPLWKSEAMGLDIVQTSKKETMLDVKYNISRSIALMLFKDAGLGHGHTDSILGVTQGSSGNKGTETLMVTPVSTRNVEGRLNMFIFTFTRPDENVVVPNTLAAISEEELSEAQAAIASVTTSEKAVQDATTKLANAKSALTAAEQKLAAVKKGDVVGAQVEAIRSLDALENAKNELVAAQNKVAELKATISEGQAKLDAYNAGAKSVADAKAKLAEAEKVLADSQVKTQDALKVYEAAQAKYKATKAEYDRLLAMRAIEDATKPANEVVKPVEDATQTVDSTPTPAEDMTVPVDEVVKPVNPANSIENVSKPADDAVVHAGDTAKPADDMTQPAENVTEHAEDVAKPVDEVATQHADNTSAPAEDAIKHAEDATQPVDNTTKPVDNGQKATKPNEAGKLALNTTKKENHNQVKTLGAGITQKADGTMSYSRVSANNTLPKTGEENNTSSFLAGLALLLSGSLFLGKRKED